MSEHKIREGDIVKHFKRETYKGVDPNAYMYKVISMNARETDNYNKVVVYESMYDNGHGVHRGDVFVRDYKEFMSEVDRLKYPDIRQKYRFERLDANRVGIP